MRILQRAYIQAAFLIKFTINYNYTKYRPLLNFTLKVIRVCLIQSYQNNVSLYTVYMIEILKY